MASGSSAKVLRRGLLLVLGGLAANLAGCAPQLPAAACAPGLGAPMLQFELFFGRAIPRRNDLTDQEWRTFLDDTVTVNLPNGYTVQDAYGAWMNPISHKTIREATKVIRVALPDVAESLAAVNRIRTTYQLRFYQQLVGMTATRTCGSF